MAVIESSSVTSPFDPAWRDHACSGLDEEGRALVLRACEWVMPQLHDQSALTGEDMAGHAAGVVRVLADLRTDAATRAAALLASRPLDLSAQLPALHEDPVAREFGTEIARLVQGSHALARLGAAARESSDSASDSRAQKEMLRKMLLAMATDLRIVLMRLASRQQTLRWYAQSRTPCNPAFARETLDLYAPLANRLGIWQIKWEMEDLAFRFLDPLKYKEIARLLEEKRVERESFITGTIARLSQALAGAGIEAEVSGRPKHIYSIWNKMRQKGLDFSQLYDLRALRVIVPDERSCFAALGLVHEMWQPVADEFDDYISRPKPNGYRSLHTVVTDEDGKPFEVQLRTHAMHQHAEYGMAAHWHYKEAGKQGGQARANGDYERQLSWLRQLLAWNSDVDRQDGKPAGPPASGVSDDDRIYVLTPQARVIELPAGSTPVDFAYYLHTDLGHRCRGARIDGQMVPLHTRLATGQTVEIISAKAGGPSRDWLNPQLGFLASPRSRAKVRAWFNAIELQQRIDQGKALVEKELQRLGKTAVKLEQLAQDLGFARADDLYVAVAKDEFSLRQVDALFQQPAQPLTDPDTMVAYASRAPAGSAGKSGVLVVGVGSLMTQLARCCRPAPPDSIAGFVTRGRGVSIHRDNCHSYAALAERHPERVIDVQWGETEGTVYPVDLSVRAHDRSGLLRDLSEVFARLRLNVVGVNTQSRQSLAHMIFTVEIGDGSQLNRALVAIGEVPGVESVLRR